MTDVINLLPDAVANQIAAGEVIQRPASAVKELMENAIDAGATSIQLIVKESGNKLIQVIDDGSGMSETDARMCFEKHATSKIKSVDDLFVIRTMGFRGEALASIAAIAQVELKTKRKEEELGTCILIEGSEVKKQEACQTKSGTNIVVKNLFYNVPARRNFLKSPAVEMRHILDEFQRIALIHNDIGFDLYHNDQEVFRLKPGNLRQRIIGIFGDKYNQKLIPVDEQTEVVNIIGFVGKSEFAKKTRGEQYFFVNQRFIKSPYLNHALMKAYQDIIPDKSFPLYVLSLEIDPKRIDINVHPTKQEIKFDDERILYAFIQSSVKHALGQYNVAPSIDFDQEVSFSNLQSVKMGPPKDIQASNFAIDRSFRNPSLHTKTEEWEKIYGIAKAPSQMSPIFFSDNGLDGKPSDKTPYQIHNKYIISPIKSGFIIIDQQAAHERIIYEELTRSLENQISTTQQELFSQTIELNPTDAALLKDILPNLNQLGFDIEEFGKNTFVINGMPPDISEDANAETLIEQILEQFKYNSSNLSLDIRESLLRSLAKSTALKKGRKLSIEEMNEVIDRLFACTYPNYTPSGKKTVITQQLNELERMFGNK